MGVGGVGLRSPRLHAITSLPHCGHARTECVCVCVFLSGDQVQMHEFVAKHSIYAAAPARPSALPSNLIYLS